MARKKKVIEEPKEEIKEEVIDDAPETTPGDDVESLIPTLFASDETVSDTTEKIVDTTLYATDAPISVGSFADNDNFFFEYDAKAKGQIEKCNLYIWAGLDWGAGRIYEMARKEWAMFLIDLYDWKASGYKGNKPEVPSEVIDE